MFFLVVKVSLTETKVEVFFIIENIIDLLVSTKIYSLNLFNSAENFIRFYAGH